jgi:hypothetical protein
MKKLLYLLVVTLVIAGASCKKDMNLKPVTSQPKIKTVEKAAYPKYDYQKAILAKRSK